MGETIGRVEVLEDENAGEVTLNGKTPFGIIWKDGRSIYFFDDSVSEEAIQAQ